jgi:hypothetical protein
VAGNNSLKKSKIKSFGSVAADIRLTPCSTIFVKTITIMTTTETMTTQEVANRFYELAQQGNWNQIQDELYSSDAKSIEPEGAQGLKTVAGLDKIKEKGKEWGEMVEQTHGGYCSKPLVAGSHFTCVMGVDATFKGQGRQLYTKSTMEKLSANNSSFNCERTY